VRGEWEAAINLIMAPRDGEKDAPKAARELYFKGDLGAANRTMPAFLSAEKAILSVSFPGNWRPASPLPRGLPEAGLLQTGTPVSIFQ